MENKYNCCWNVLSFYMKSWSCQNFGLCTCSWMQVSFISNHIMCSRMIQRIAITRVSNRPQIWFASYDTRLMAISSCSLEVSVENDSDTVEDCSPRWYRLEDEVQNPSWLENRAESSTILTCDAEMFLSCSNCWRNSFIGILKVVWDDFMSGEWCWIWFWFGRILQVPGKFDVIEPDRKK